MSKGNMEILAEDKVMCKSHVNFNSAWLCMLDRILTFVGTLDPASF